MGRTDRLGSTFVEDVRDYIFQITLYQDGTIGCHGLQPDDLAEVLRILAQAAEEGRIAWGQPN